MEIIKPILCVCCAEMAAFCKDRHGGFYVACTYCGTHLFFKTTKAQEGYMLTAALLEPHVLAHQATLRSRYEANLMQQSATRIADQKKVEREAREKKRARRDREE
jgi:hypothetical protein